MAFIKNKFFWIPAAILFIIIAVFVFGRPGLKSDNIHNDVLLKVDSFLVYA